MTSIASQGYACESFNGKDIPILFFPPKFDSINPDKDYVYQLIQLILKKSNDKFGPCEVTLLDHRLPLKRIELYIQKNRLIDIAAFTVTNERSSKMLPIEIPISKGLMGYRLLMIHKNDVNKFSSIKRVSDLRKFMAGQGTGWADVKILETNNLPVLTTGSIKTLIDMLAHNRFDYFPRGALQISTEIKTYQDKPVIIEPSIVLRYPSMTALYVNSDNIKLAKRLEYGLKKSYDDGSFDQFFNSHPSSITALANLDLDKRKVLDLCNPILPTWVPVKQSKYWLEPWSDKIINNDCVNNK